MHGKILCIELGSIYTKVADINVSNKAYTVDKTFVLATPPGTITDGYIKDDETLCNELFAELFKYGMNKRKVAFHIASSKIINREIVLPYVSRSKIKSLILANAGEYFPVDLKRYRVSWKIMNSFTSEEGLKKMKVMVIAVPLELLDCYYAFAKSLNMQVESIDYAGNSIYQLMKSAQIEGTTVSVDIGERSTMISIVKNGILELQRTFGQGVYDIINSYADTNEIIEINYMSILDDLKHNERINAVLPMISDEPDDPEDMTEDMRQKAANTETLRFFVDRVGRVIHYYTSNMGDGTINQMIVTGQGAGIQNLPQLLQFELGIPSRDVSLIKSIRMNDKNAGVSGATAEEVATAIGLSDLAMSIGSVIDPLDLLSKKVKTSKTIKHALAISVAVFMAGLIATGTLMFIAYSRVKSAEEKQAKLESRKASMSSIDNTIQRFDEANALYTSFIDMETYTRNVNEDFVKIIEYFEETLPSGAVFTSLSVSSNGMSMTVEAGGWHESADILAIMRACPAFESVTISSVSRDTKDVKVDNDKYLVGGILYESLDGVDLTDADGNELEVTEVEAGETVEAYYTTFSISATYKAVDSYSWDAEAEETTTGEVTE